VNTDDYVARELGIHSAYDYGADRITWIGHALTNWMGDDGFLKKLMWKSASWILSATPPSARQGHQEIQGWGRPSGRPGCLGGEHAGRNHRAGQSHGQAAFQRSSRRAFLFIFKGERVTTSIYQ